MEDWDRERLPTRMVLPPFLPIQGLAGSTKILTEIVSTCSSSHKELIPILIIGGETLDRILREPATVLVRYRPMA